MNTVIQGNPPRRIRRCGHCREEGHNISKCVKLRIDTLLNIHGRQRELYNTQLRRSFKMSSISLDKLAQVKLLIDEQIPYMVFDNYIVRLDRTNNKLTVTNENPSQEMKNIARIAIVENAETITNYTNEYLTRISHIRQTCKYPEWQHIVNIIKIINGDYVEYAREVAQRDREAEERFQQYLAQRRNQEIEVERVHARALLPIIRDTPIEAEDCPICLEPIGETGKSILRCGHQICMGCLITQTFRSAATRDTNRCICPVCRTTYV